MQTCLIANSSTIDKNNTNLDCLIYIWDETCGHRMVMMYVGDNFFIAFKEIFEVNNKKYSVYIINLGCLH